MRPLSATAACARRSPALPERDRSVIACRFVLDLGEQETAAVLGIARGTVKSRTARALDRLRGALEVEA